MGARRGPGPSITSEEPTGLSPFAMAAPSSLPLRRALGANELFLHSTEALYGGTFRIAGVATLSSPAFGPGRLTAPRLSASIAAVARRFETLHSIVEVVADGRTAFLAADDAVPRVDVRMSTATGADALTAEAFAAAEVVLAAGPDGPWKARVPVLEGTTPARPHLPWQVMAFLPPSKEEGEEVFEGAAARGEPRPTPAVATAAAAVVWLLPHYISDGTSLDFLCAALVDALNADTSTTAASEVAAAGVSRMDPPLTALFPPWGGRFGAAVGLGRFLVSAALNGLTRSRVRGVVPAAPVRSPGAPAEDVTGSASAATSRRSGVAVAVVAAPALARFRAAAKEAGVTLGAALVGALAVALADTGVLAPAGWWRSSVVVAVPMNARLASDALPDTALGNYVGSVDVAMTVPPPPIAVGDGGVDRGSEAAARKWSRMWVAAGAAATALHAPGARVSGANRMGVACGVLTGPHGPPFLESLIADPVAAGRLLPDPFLSNVGCCRVTEAANGRAGATGVTVTRLGLWDWEAQLGAPLGLYVATVGGVATLVMTWTEPLVTADVGRAVLAAVVGAVEAPSLP